MRGCEGPRHLQSRTGLIPGEAGSSNLQPLVVNTDYLIILKLIFTAPKNVGRRKLLLPAKLLVPAKLEEESEGCTFTFWYFKFEGVALL